MSFKHGSAFPLNRDTHTRLNNDENRDKEFFQYQYVLFTVVMLGTMVNVSISNTGAREQDGEWG